MPTIYYTEHNLSKLYRAWENHYKQMGLSASKMLKLVHKKVSAKKCPPNMKLEDLMTSTNYFK